MVEDAVHNSGKKQFLLKFSMSFDQRKLASLHRGYMSWRRTRAVWQCTHPLIKVLMSILPTVADNSKAEMGFLRRIRS